MAYNVLLAEKLKRELLKALEVPPKVIYRCIVCQAAEQADRKSRRCGKCEASKQ